MFRPIAPTLANRTQFRLLGLAAIFLFLDSLALTLSPAARLRSFEVAYRWEHWLGFALWLAVFWLAHAHTARYLPDRDPYLLPAAALLSGWGLLAIWRLTPFFGLRQSLWLLVSVGLFIAGLRLPANLAFLYRYKYLWLTAGLLLTALTLLFGTNPAGVDFPRLWLGCCGVYFQPSEPLKLLLIIYLAAYLAGSPSSGRSPVQAISNRLLPLLAPTLIMSGLALLLLTVQRDLGTASIFLFLYTATVYVATGRPRVLLVGVLGMALAGAAGYALFDVVRLRVDAWLNPWLDPSGRSYQIVQSLLAVANGGIFGRGPGLGSPGLVPIPHSDFIYAAIIEEHGLVGGVGLLILFALLANRGLSIALAAEDLFRRYLAAGLTAFLVAQCILIVGGNLRLLPLTGVTLPFVSYGGSSLLTSLLSLLLLLKISSRSETQQAPLIGARPYLQLAGFLFAGLSAAALATGWWTVYRSPDLLARTDNPRRAIVDRYVYRGAIVDRRNDPLASSTGQAGAYQRSILYPPLSPVVGYTNPIYGQSGLEESMDAYLRGSQGNPVLDIWWNQLLYGQPPPGRDIRLSLDLHLQRLADNALAGSTGALVLLDASSGEILAMASHPYFDANRIEQDWQQIISDQNAPLLNRATQGSYPVGSLASLLFAPGQADTWMATLPQIRLPAGEQPAAQAGSSPALSPLQVALAAAPLSAEGVRPAALLVTAVNTPESGWVFLPALDKPERMRSPAEAAAIAQSLAQPELSIWQSVAVVRPDSSGQTVTWYVGGSLPGWGGASLTIALLLEQDNPDQAQRAGQQVLRAAMQP